MFDEGYRVVEESARWWITFALVMVGVAWNAFVLEQRHVSREVLLRGGVILGMAALAVASIVVHRLQARRERR